MKETVLNEIERTDRERAADLLEDIYEAWRNNRAYDRNMAMHDKPMTKWEYKRIENILVSGGYLEDTKENEPFLLTTRGKEFAAETLEKHEYIKEFLKEICNVEEEIADRDACRIEHVVSEDIMQGIRQFMKQKKVSNRIIQGKDLSILYEAGKYWFDMGIYENDNRYPRNFSEEMELFQTEIRAVVEAKSYFVLIPKSGKEELQLYYRYDEQWVQAPYGKDGYIINSDAFTYTVSANIPVIEGETLVAFGKDGKIPQDAEIKNLNIHLW